MHDLPDHVLNSLKSIKISQIQDMIRQIQSMIRQIQD